MTQASPQNSVVEVRGLRAAYEGRTVLQDINLAVKRGEIFVILGGSGCGKSTLLKHMIGLSQPVAGEVFIDGRNLVEAADRERSEIMKKIGVMYQSGALFGSLTLRENVQLPLDIHTNLPEKAKQMIVVNKLGLVGLIDAADRLPTELSGGMIKRAAIARAMAIDPLILFLDEPGAGLDPITAAGLDELIRELAKTLGITFVVVTHELQSIFSITDRAIMLDAASKTIIAEGRPEELRQRTDCPVVWQFFNRSVKAPPGGPTKGPPS